MKNNYVIVMYMITYHVYDINIYDMFQCYCTFEKWHVVKWGSQVTVTYHCTQCKIIDQTFPTCHFSQYWHIVNVTLLSKDNEALIYVRILW